MADNFKYRHPDDVSILKLWVEANVAFVNRTSLNYASLGQTCTRVAWICPCGSPFVK